MQSRRMLAKSSPFCQGWMIYLILVVLTGLVGCGDATVARSYRVAKVYDGDTIRLANGTKVRLIGIDCPEMRENDKLGYDARRANLSPGLIMRQGKQAYEFVRQLLGGGHVQLDYDIERKDKYGRLLAYVWLEVKVDEKDGLNDFPEYYVFEYRAVGGERKRPFLFVNATLLNAGYARPMSIPPNTRYAEEFRSLYQAAREHRRGLWQNLSPAI